MHIGVPKEIKVHEYRVGLMPASVAELIAAGHAVTVADRRGGGIGISRRATTSASARTIAATADAVFASADMIVKVKEPQPPECASSDPGQMLFTYLHLAADPEQTEGLMKSGATCIAYETVTARRTARCRCSRR